MVDCKQTQWWTTGVFSLMSVLSQSQSVYCLQNNNNNNNRISIPPLVVTSEAHMGRQSNMVSNRSTAIYPGLTPGDLVAELSETLTQYTIFIVFKFLTSTPSLSSQASQYICLWRLILGTTRETTERNVKNPKTRTHTSIIFVEGRVARTLG